MNAALGHGPPAEGGLATVRPRYGAASLADIMPGVLAALGVPGAPDPLGLSTGPLAGVRRVAVLLIDGLGHQLLPMAAPYAPNLVELVSGRHARAITAGFPSTTPTSLTSLGTGSPPGSHGLMGFTVNVPGTDRVLNHIHWGDDPDPALWQPLTTQFERAEASGVATHVVGAASYAGSGLTLAAYRGSRYHGAEANGVPAAMLGRLHRGRGRALVYGYYPHVDTMGHLYGLNSPQWRAAVTEVDWLVGAILHRLPAHTALVVTADHGQVNVPAEHRFDIDSDPSLRAGVRLVAGEPRVRYLHVEPGAGADVIAAWRGILGDAAWVVSREEAVAEGWFGAVREGHLARIGDVVVACHGDFAVLATRTEPPRVAELIAYHGSATEAEMMIPLLIGLG